ncbi:mechanosensitive ion channel family protein [Granulosicoccus antarcticus]|uniref:Small-conductance mechanosensitive channel n=1 Tax=Granulosicoccus antarcticus IMCC3135 TaxID=1192854 RepID=A0A2Z2NY47_9GAMM|nr:mechanosensitive ion channel family protein [Granulosicoccus antarcticus]ASJ76372.1 Small-conductance mechanosensitive channel [Granulosicoccus antarcticus IMCC3135]
MEEIDADTGNIFEKLDAWLDGFLRLLPNIGVALVVLVLAIVLAHLLAKLTHNRAVARDRQSLGEVASALIKWGIILLGIMFAVSIVAPSIKPADILAGLGVGSVAIGFAFKDILQNMLAGILILLRQPFEVGDQIVSGGHEGTVEKIETRATFLKTYDGTRVVIPNSDIYTNSVVVKTAFDSIRSEYDIGVGCNDSWDDAKRLILEAASGCEGVLADPAPEVIPVALADFSNNIRLRWWTKSDRSSVIHTFGRVIEAVYINLDKNGIDMPYPTSVMLWHDQTEETDGDRKRQREGWPAGQADVPKAARISGANSSEGS